MDPADLFEHFVRLWQAFVNVVTVAPPPAIVPVPSVTVSDGSSTVADWAQVAAAVVASVAVVITAYGLKQARVQHRATLDDAATARYREAAKEALSAAVAALQDYYRLVKGSKWMEELSKRVVEEAIELEAARKAGVRRIVSDSYRPDLEERARLYSELQEANLLAKQTLNLLLLYFKPLDEISQLASSAYMKIEFAKLSISLDVSQGRVEAQEGDVESADDGDAAKPAEGPGRIQEARTALGALMTEVGNFARAELPDDENKLTAEQVAVFWWDP